MVTETQVFITRSRVSNYEINMMFCVVGSVLSIEVKVKELTKFYC